MLYLFAYLGKGLFVFGDDKNGVIAKTAATLHLETDYAVTFSCRAAHQAVFIRDTYRADIMGSAFFKGDTLQ